MSRPGRGLWPLAIFAIAASSGNVFAGNDPLDKDRQGRLSYEMHRVARAAETGQPVRTQARRGLMASGDRIQAVLELAAAQSAGAVTAQVNASGGKVVASSGTLLKVELPAASLRGISSAAGVSHVRAPFKPSRKLVTSEGVSTIHAPEYHARTGATGAGVRVGILDASFAHARDLVGGELPDGVQATDAVRAKLDSYEDVHGTACAEIVHDVAPEANLILAEFEDEVTWAQAIDELVGSGVRVISHSIGFDNLFPPDGNHYFAQKVDQVAAAGVLFVTAAGNEAGNYYQGTWKDADSDLFMEFGATGAELLPVFATAPGSRAVLRWDEPFGAATHDYDLLVVTADFANNPTLSKDNPAILAASADLQSETRNPREILEFEVPSDQIVYLVVVRDPSTPANPAQRFWLHAAGGVDPAFMNAAGSLSLPADSRGALTVGASPFSSPVTVEGYSSRGPTLDGRMKPEIAGPDAVATASYQGQPFSGTSAATPHVAGAAALALSRNPTLSVSALQSLLEQATQSGGRGGNNDLGFGTIDLNLVK